MCGIGGIVSFGVELNYFHQRVVSQIGNAQRLRGPDSSSSLELPDAGVILTHQRLKILDLRDISNQPMVSEYSANAIVFNGEIFNYIELKERLTSLGYKFNTLSDTEVILKLYDKYGTDCFSMLEGMFAIAIFDSQRSKLVIARDRWGIKPVYFCRSDLGFVFASQVKSLSSCNFLPELRPNKRAEIQFLALGSIQDPDTIYDDIKAILSGCFYEICTNDTSQPIRRTRFRSIFEFLISKQTITQPNRDSFKSLTTAMQSHSTSDVGRVLFHSAGIDSNLLFKICVDNSIEFDSVTIGFNAFDRNEFSIPKTVCGNFGILWNKCSVSAQSLSEATRNVLEVMDQPSIDGLNIFLASRFAASLGHKVAFSGAGADEIFGSYSYNRVANLALHNITNFSAGLFKGVKFSSRTKPSRYRLYRLLSGIGDVKMVYLALRGIPCLSSIAEQYEVTYEDLLYDILFCDDNEEFGHRDGVRPNVMYSILEIKKYLGNQLLRDADWAGMGNSVEIRVPFLDSQFAEMILKSRNMGFSVKKEEVLKYAGNDFAVFKEIANRKKTGFSVPQPTGHPTDGLVASRRRFFSSFI